MKLEVGHIFINDILATQLSGCSVCLQQLEQFTLQELNTTVVIFDFLIDLANPIFVTNINRIVFFYSI